MSRDFHGPASHSQAPPTVHEEKAHRIYHRDAIAVIFKRRPLEELEASDLRIVTLNYQQRLSDCRTELGMKVVYTKRWITREDGSKQRIEGTWRYQPYGEQLGPSSDQHRAMKRLF